MIYVQDLLHEFVCLFYPIHLKQIASWNTAREHTHRIAQILCHCLFVTDVADHLQLGKNTALAANSITV